MPSRSSLYALQALACAGGVRAIVNYSHPALLTDINEISKHWGQISPYADNPADIFGVKDVGLPDGCQVEQGRMSGPLDRQIADLSSPHDAASRSPFPHSLDR